MQRSTSAFVTWSRQTTTPATTSRYEPPPAVMRSSPSSTAAQRSQTPGCAARRPTFSRVGPAALALRARARARRATDERRRRPARSVTWLTMNRLARLPGKTRALRLVRAQRRQDRGRRRARVTWASRLDAIRFGRARLLERLGHHRAHLEQRRPAREHAPRPPPRLPGSSASVHRRPRAAGDERPHLVGGEGQDGRHQARQVVGDAVQHASAPSAGAAPSAASQ